MQAISISFSTFQGNVLISCRTFASDSKRHISHPPSSTSSLHITNHSGSPQSYLTKRRNWNRSIKMSKGPSAQDTGSKKASPTHAETTEMKTPLPAKENKQDQNASTEESSIQERIRRKKKAIVDILQSMSNDVPQKKNEIKGNEEMVFQNLRNADEKRRAEDGGVHGRSAVLEKVSEWRKHVETSDQDPNEE